MITSRRVEGVPENIHRVLEGQCIWFSLLRVIIELVSRIQWIFCHSTGLFSPKEGQVVLAGDPKQLGPILRSPLAIQYGLGETAAYLMPLVFIILHQPMGLSHQHLLSSTRFGFWGFPLGDSTWKQVLFSSRLVGVPRELRGTKNVTAGHELAREGRHWMGRDRDFFMRLQLTGSSNCTFIIMATMMRWRGFYARRLATLDGAGQCWEKFQNGPTQVGLGCIWKRHKLTRVQLISDKTVTEKHHICIDLHGSLLNTAVTCWKEMIETCFCCQCMCQILIPPLQVFLYWSDWWGTTLYTSRTPRADTLITAMSPNCCETTGTSFTSSSPFLWLLVQKVNWVQPPSGHTLLFWEFPVSCSMKMSCRCSLTSGIVRPTATGNICLGRFATNWSSVACRQIRGARSHVGGRWLSLLRRVSLWSSTGWWGKTRERATVLRSSTWARLKLWSTTSLSCWRHKGSRASPNWTPLTSASSLPTGNKSVASYDFRFFYKTRWK